MKKAFITTSAIMILLTLVFSLLSFQTDMDIFLTLAITFGTISYHFVMRLTVGAVFDSAMKNNADYTKKWYQPKKWEEKLYKLLRVKKWKGKVPMFVPDYFDLRKRSLHEAAMAMCQAELVHETILILNFLPILSAIWFGALPVFVITSLFAAVMELVCIIAQRYNRPRIIRIMNRQKSEQPSKKSSLPLDKYGIR